MNPVTTALISAFLAVAQSIGIYSWVSLSQVGPDFAKVRIFRLYLA